MKLFTMPILEKLQDNGRISHQAREDGGDDIDFVPVVKLFTPDGSATWLLTEMDPEDHDIVYGVCDLGLGCVEYGPVRVSELRVIRGKLMLPVERDRYFSCDKPASEFLNRTSLAGV